MKKVFTAIFLLLTLIAFQNCSGPLQSPDKTDALGDTPPGYKLVSTTSITADSLLIGYGFPELVAEASIAMMPENWLRVELSMNKDELAQYSSDRTIPARFCDLSTSPEYVELKQLLLKQKVCHFESVITEAEKAARQPVCMTTSYANSLSYDFQVYAAKPGEPAVFLTNVFSKRAWLDNLDPYCEGKYVSFCSDDDSNRITDLARSLANQIYTLSNCR